MRTPITCLLAVAALLASAGSASAWAFNARVRGGLLPSYEIGDTVTVDIFMDADVGLTILGLGVNVPASSLDYDPVASDALPIIYPAAGSGLLRDDRQPPPGTSCTPVACPPRSCTRSGTLRTRPSTSGRRRARACSR